MFFVPNAANVEYSLSGICFLSRMKTNVEKALSGERLGKLGILGNLEELGSIIRDMIFVTNVGQVSVW